MWGTNNGLFLGLGKEGSSEKAPSDGPEGTVCSCCPAPSSPGGPALSEHSAPTGKGTGPGPTPGLACPPQGATVEGVCQGSAVRVAYSTQRVSRARAGRAGRKGGKVYRLPFVKRFLVGKARLVRVGCELLGAPGKVELEGVWTRTGPVALGPGGWLSPPGRGPHLMALVALDLDLPNEGMSSLGLPGTRALSHTCFPRLRPSRS